MPDFHAICKTSDVPEGEGRMFVIDGRMIGLFNVAGEMHALDNACPHAGASLAHGIVEGNVVSCRIHHWKFCISNGKYLDRDCPEYDAKTIPVRVVGGDVEIAIQ